MILSSLSKQRLSVASCPYVLIHLSVIVLVSCTYVGQHYDVVFGQVYVCLYRVGLGFNRTSKSAHSVLRMFGFVPSMGDHLWQFSTTRTFSRESPGRWVKSVGIWSLGWESNTHVKVGQPLHLRKGSRRERRKFDCRVGMAVLGEVQSSR